MNLLLEVNSRGSWARVGEFDEALLGSVRRAVLILDSVFREPGLARAESGHAPSWRVVKPGGRSPKVVWRYGK